MPKAIANLPLVSDPSIISYYPLENANDSIGGHNLTNDNSTPFNAAKFSNGAEFNGSNQALRLTDTNPFFTGTANDKFFTFWMKLLTQPATNTTKTPFVWGNAASTSYIQIVDDAGTKKIRLTDGNTGSSDIVKALDITKFHNFIYSYNATSKVWKLYLDGVKIGQYTSSSPAANGKFSIGYAQVVGQYINAIIDDLAVFGRQATQGDINMINGISPAFFNFL